MTLKDLSDIANTLTVIGLLALILYGGSRPAPWWVFGAQFRDKERECEEWKQLALQNLNLANQVGHTARDALGVARNVTGQRAARRPPPDDP